MTQTQVAAETITSGVNEGRFIEHLRLMFSNKDTVLAEMMQNARRAGASFVRFDYDEESRTLSVTDDGCGLSDFSVLITVADSGWSEETMRSELPFGLGFSSVSFAAETVLVESRGKKVEFSSEDLIAKRPIRVQTADFIGGTRIGLRGCKLHPDRIAISLKKLASGFSTPVFWKGEEMPRPYAIENLITTKTPVGEVHVPGIHNWERSGQYYKNRKLFCQGLPISTGYDRVDYNDCFTVIHVDHVKYQPRMPDRESFIDSAEAIIAFDLAVTELWRAHLEAEKSVLSAEQFVNTYWDAAIIANLREVMNDVPIIPANALEFVNDTPRITDFGHFYEMHNAPVTQGQVESGSVVLWDTIDESNEGDAYAKLMFAQRQGCLFPKDVFHKKHWAVPFFRSLDDSPAKISGKVIASERFAGRFVSADVRVIENLAVTVAGTTVKIDEPFVLGSYHDGTLAILSPKGNTYAGETLQQASAYTDSNDVFCETDLCLDQDELSDLLSIMNGESGEVTLKKVLVAANTSGMTNLRNTAYIVRFDEKGNIAVEAAV